MPRKPIKTPEEIYDALKKFKFIGEDGSYLGYTNEVWEDAYIALNRQLEKCYIYL